MYTEHIPTTEEAEGWSIDEDRHSYLKHQTAGAITDTSELLSDEWYRWRASGLSVAPTEIEHVRQGLIAQLNEILFSYQLSVVRRRGYRHYN